LRLAEERYLLGLTDFVTLVEAQRSAFNAESQLIVVRRQLLDNRVSLHLALGGGFDTSAGDLYASQP
jgi:outer membrane protein TolC